GQAGHYRKKSAVPHYAPPPIEYGCIECDWLEIGLARTYGRSPFAGAPRSVAAFLDVRNATGLRRHMSAGKDSLQPVEHVIVNIQPTEVRNAPERVALVLHHPHF